jgi:hypothetical protein
MGSTVGFAQDTSTSFTYSAAASELGDGFCNNRVYPLNANIYDAGVVSFDSSNQDLLKD